MIPAVLAAWAAWTGCDIRGPGLVTEPDRAGGAGGAGGSLLATAIVGSWERVLFVQTETTVFTSTTVWTFGADGACEKQLTTRDLSGFSDTVVEPCTYTVAGNTVTIRWTRNGATVTFGATVTGDILVFGDTEYRRV